MFTFSAKKPCNCVGLNIYRTDIYSTAALNIGPPFSLVCFAGRFPSAVIVVSSRPSSRSSVFSPHNIPFADDTPPSILSRRHEMVRPIALLTRYRDRINVAIITLTGFVFAIALGRYYIFGMSSVSLAYSRWK
jgi:hypothetical protein